MKGKLIFIDKLIRVIAIFALIPVIFFAFIMGIMGSGADGAIFPMLVSLTLAGIVSIPILFSSIAPDFIEKPFFGLGFFSYILIRLPSYIFAPYGVYYGGKFLL